MAVNSAADTLNFRNGLDAIFTKYKHQILYADSGQIVGSVDIDGDTKAKYPQTNRWDYVIGYKREDRTEVAYFIEVHPATDKEVARVMAKADTLKEWALKNAPDLWKMPKGINGKIHWIASGKIKITLHSRERKLLLRHPFLLAPKTDIVLK